MKKTTKILLALVLLFGSFTIFQVIQKARVTYGIKHVSIEVIDERSGTTLNELTEFKTHADYLGQLMDELTKEGAIVFSLSGKSTDQYGRMLTGIGETKHEPRNNQYWTYTSSNNKECVAATYCTGIDLLPIHDGDVFTFTIK